MFRDYKGNEFKYAVIKHITDNGKQILTGNCIFLSHTIESCVEYVHSEYISQKHHKGCGFLYNICLEDKHNVVRGFNINNGECWEVSK